MKNFYQWLAGFIDGDGCFCISLHATGASLHVGFGVTVGVKGNDGHITKYIKKESKLGRLYISNKGQENEIARWQTTNIEDSIRITKRTLPHLRLKKKKAKQFLKCAEWYKTTCRASGGRRQKAKRLRTNKQMKRLIKTALEINYDRQVKRYRNKKGLEFWYKYLDRYYKN